MIHFSHCTNWRREGEINFVNSTAILTNKFRFEQKFGEVCKLKFSFFICGTKYSGMDFTSYLYNTVCASLRIRIRGIYRMPYSHSQRIEQLSFQILIPLSTIRLCCRIREGCSAECNWQSFCWSDYEWQLWKCRAFHRIFFGGPIDCLGYIS